MKLTRIILCLTAAGLMGSHVWADELKARINKTDTPARISRPATPPLTLTSGATVKTALDPTNFGGKTLKARNFAVDAQRLMAIERNWQSARGSRDTGLSMVSAQLTIALCPPGSARQRDAWNVLMTELGDPKVSPAWHQWQETLCNQIVESRFFSKRAAGSASFHIRIMKNGVVDLRHGGSPGFDDTVRAELQTLVDAGKMRLPSVTEADEVHALVYVNEVPLDDSSR